MPVLDEVSTEFAAALIEEAERIIAQTAPVEWSMSEMISEVRVTIYEAGEHAPHGPPAATPSTASRLLNIWANVAGILVIPFDFPTPAEESDILPYRPTVSNQNKPRTTLDCFQFKELRRPAAWPRLSRSIDKWATESDADLERVLSSIARRGTSAHPALSGVMRGFWTKTQGLFDAAFSKKVRSSPDNQRRKYTHARTRRGTDRERRGT